MDRETAVAGMRDAAGLWYVGQGSAADIVYAACDLLAAGVDGPSLGMLAAVSVHHADDEVSDLLGPALRDVGLVHHPKGSQPAREAGLRAMAARVLSGALTPRAMTAWTHSAYGHDTFAAAERFAEFDDDYDLLDYTGASRQELDAQVRAEAHRVLTTPPNPQRGGTRTGRPR